MAGLSCWLTPEAHALDLFDGSLGQAPTEQGELILGVIGIPPSPLDTPFFVASGGETLPAGGGVLINSGQQFMVSIPPFPPYPATAEYAGYSNYLPLVPEFIGSSASIVQTNRFSLFFDVDLISTTENSPDRAAFSVLAVGAGNRGIELAWDTDDQIFAQNQNFSRGEEVTVAAGDPNTYELLVEENTYSLRQAGIQILTGPLRTYTFDPSNSSPPLPFNPYELPGFLFLGDNTGQESGEFLLRSASITAARAPVPTESVPGPAGLLGVPAALGWAARLRRRRRCLLSSGQCR